MEPGLFSEKFEVRELDSGDIPAILALCRTNPLFYRHCPPEPDAESIGDDMRALPPGRAAENKHYVGFFNGLELAAVMDIIDGYPDEKTTFIGFFMVDARFQGRGVGSGIIAELCRYLSRAGYREIRLGWVEANPQAAHFWRKNGFSETSVTYGTCGYTVIVGEKRL